MKKNDDGRAETGPGVRRCYGWFPAVAATVLAALVSMPAGAAFIYVTPLVDGTVEGGSVDFDISVGGLEPRLRPDEIVSAFDFDFFFDPTVLSFSGLTFGSSFGCDVDPLTFCGVDDSASGLVDFFAYSGLPDDELASAQGGVVHLASLSFVGLAPGFSLVGVTPSWLDENFVLTGRLGGDGFPGDLRVLFNQPALAYVKPVPEPGTLALLGIGLLGLGATARRRRGARG